MKRAAINVTAITVDVGHPAASAVAYAARIVARVQSAWATGADCVLLPEFLWLGLESFVHETEPQPRLAAVASVFWQDLLANGHLDALLRPGKMAVLGTVPFLGKNGLHNRSPIAVDGRWHFQDKLVLTPWESVFVGGEALQPFVFKDCRCVVLVCLDSEIPEHSVALRGAAVDLLLVPSATETQLGVERIARCASARAVELGCVVVVSHLTGKLAISALVDENIGQVAAFFPSQHSFRKCLRQQTSGPVDAGELCLQISVPLDKLDHMRRLKAETNPAHLRLGCETKVNNWPF